MASLSLTETLFQPPPRKEASSSEGADTHKVVKESPSNLWGTLNLSHLSNHRLSEREREALTTALATAWSSRDPVRWILVRVRAELLGLTARKYAAEVGLAPHSLITKEQKGGTKVAPSTYSHFLRDWEGRGHANSPQRSTFERAATLLLHHLLGTAYLGFAGLLTRWQCRSVRTTSPQRPALIQKHSLGIERTG